MRRTSRILCGLCLIFACCERGLSAWADDLDAASQEGLAKTQALLVNPEQRSEAIAQSPNAQLIDAQVSSLAGNKANADEMYQISSAIFGDLVKETGGDLLKLQDILAKAKDDPKSLLAHLSDSSKAMLQKISGKIADQPTMTQTPASSK